VKGRSRAEHGYTVNAWSADLIRPLFVRRSPPHGGPRRKIPALTYNLSLKKRVQSCATSLRTQRGFVAQVLPLLVSLCTVMTAAVARGFRNPLDPRNRRVSSLVRSEAVGTLQEAAGGRF
jgi:hypothetical protein